jgi:LEA14-like dessication related protein
MRNIRQLLFMGPLLLTLLGGCSSLFQRPEPPQISLASIRPVDIGLFEQRYRLRLRVQNPNPFALRIQGMDYSLYLNEQQFAQGVSPASATVPAYGEQLVEVDVVSNLARLFDQFSEFGRQRGLSYRLVGGIRLANVAARIPFEYQGEISLAPKDAGPPDRWQPSSKSETL